MGNIIILILCLISKFSTMPLYKSTLNWQLLPRARIIVLRFTSPMSDRFRKIYLMINFYISLMLNVGYKILKPHINSLAPILHLPKWMTETDCSTVDIRLGRVEVQELHVGYRHSTEGLVDLEHSHIILLHPRLFIQLGHGKRWRYREVYWLSGGVSKRWSKYISLHVPITGGSLMEMLTSIFCFIN